MESAWGPGPFDNGAAADLVNWFIESKLPPGKALMAMLNKVQALLDIKPEDLPAHTGRAVEEGVAAAAFMHDVAFGKRTYSNTPYAQGLELDAVTCPGRFQLEGCHVAMVKAASAPGFEATGALENLIRDLETVINHELENSL